MIRRSEIEENSKQKHNFSDSADIYSKEPDQALVERLGL